ncbi:MAG: hypothetical protein HQK50_06980 [Oligoflexia bacterium]|nr:hypothetical protein [Oligoflexia bacterium]
MTGHKSSKQSEHYCNLDMDTKEEASKKLEEFVMDKPRLKIVNGDWPCFGFNKKP